MANLEPLQRRLSIYQALLAQETKSSAGGKYCEWQPQVDYKRREVAVSWIAELSAHYGHSPSTLARCVRVFDRILDAFVIDKSEIQMAACAAVWFASSVSKDKNLPDIAQLAYMTDGAYTEQQVAEARDRYERSNIVRRALHEPTVVTFLDCLLHAFEVQGAPQLYCKYLAEVSLLEYGLVSCPPSIVAWAILSLVLYSYRCSYKHLLAAANVDAERVGPPALCLLACFFKSASSDFSLMHVVHDRYRAHFDDAPGDFAGAKDAKEWPIHKRGSASFKLQPGFVVDLRRTQEQNGGADDDDPRRMSPFELPTGPRLARSSSMDGSHKMPDLGYNINDCPIRHYWYPIAGVPSDLNRFDVAGLFLTAGVCELGARADDQDDEAVAAATATTTHDSPAVATVLAQVVADAADNKPCENAHDDKRDTVRGAGGLAETKTGTATKPRPPASSRVTVDGKRKKPPTTAFATLLSSPLAMQLASNVRRRTDKTTHAARHPRRLDPLSASFNVNLPFHAKSNDDLLQLVARRVAALKKPSRSQNVALPMLQPRSRFAVMAHGGGGGAAAKAAARPRPSNHHLPALGGHVRGRA